jgi:acyl carrier protein
MEVDEIKLVVQRYVSDSMLFEKIGMDDSLLTSGAIDSTGIFELVGFLDNKFKIKIDNDEIDPENLDTVSQIAVFVKSKMELSNS